MSENESLQLDQTIQQKQPKYCEKTLTAIKLVDAGLSPLEALKYTNLKDKISKDGICKFKKKYDKYSLTHPSLIKPLYSQLKRIAKGMPREIVQQKVTKNGDIVDYIERIVPSDTNIISIAGMYYDRVHPVIKQQINVNVPVHPVDLSTFDNFQNHSIETYFTTVGVKDDDK